MQYLIIATEDEAAFARRTEEGAEAYWSAWGRYAQALREAGVLITGAGLEPPDTATTVQIRNGDRIVQDGPFAETKEQLGGVFVVDVEDLDAAIDWAAECPSAAYASVEIRPLLP